LSLPQRAQLVVAIIGSAIHVGKLGVARGEIALPAGVAGIRFRQTVSDYEAVAVGLERADKVTLIYLRVAEPVIRTRQIALPAGVAGIRFRQTVSDGKAVAVGLERAGKVTLAASCTSPTLSYDTDRSRCQLALAGSDFASRSMMARLSWYDVSAAARSPRAFCTSPTLFNALTLG
jgi:hypothetical protein